MIDRYILRQGLITHKAMQAVARILSSSDFFLDTAEEDSEVAAAAAVTASSSDENRRVLRGNGGGNAAAPGGGGGRAAEDTDHRFYVLETGVLQLRYNGVNSEEMQEPGDCLGDVALLYVVVAVVVVVVGGIIHSFTS